VSASVFSSWYRDTAYSRKVRVDGREEGVRHGMGMWLVDYSKGLSKRCFVSCLPIRVSPLNQASL
jgi:hypothetical protein